MPEYFIEGLQCPYCSSNRIIAGVHSITCENCRRAYPIVNEIPVMIDETRSVFTIASVLNREKNFFNFTGTEKFIQRISRSLPALQSNRNTKKNFFFLKEQLKKRINPKILVLGAGYGGKGIKEFTETRGLFVVRSDVCIGPDISIVFDAHSIPYGDNFFDCVIVQAVLEHVLDPQQCVREIYRVLKQGGFVYSEIPFMQQVHGGPYDFTRFTRSGHRWLFKDFAEVDSGLLSGPASALAWSIQYFFLSIFSFSRFSIFAIKTLMRCILFWLKYCDALLSYSKGASDAAASFYFIGMKEGEPISRADIVQYYYHQARKKAVNERK